MVTVALPQARPAGRVTADENEGKGRGDVAYNWAQAQARICKERPRQFLSVNLADDGPRSDD